MALNWITALKLIPWVDVVQATPTIVRGAKELWNRANAGAKKTAVADADAPVKAGSIEELTQRLTQLESAQLEASALINTLAEQNARLVAALDNLRNKAKVLSAFCVLLALSSLALWLR